MPESYTRLSDGQVVNNKNVEVPKDRSFRDAWVMEDDVVEVDMTKARELFREQVRRVRDKEFEKADSEWFKAMESGDSERINAAVARKQELRDAPDDLAIDNASTPEELKQVKPAGLTVFE